MVVRKITRAVAEAPGRATLELISGYLKNDLTPMLKEIRKALNQQRSEYYRIYFSADSFSCSAPSGSFTAVDTVGTGGDMAAIFDPDWFPEDLVPGTTRTIKLVVLGALASGGGGYFTLYDESSNEYVEDSEIEVKGTTTDIHESDDISGNLASGEHIYEVHYRYNTSTPNADIRQAYLLISYAA